jgi:cap2 methyltransferase
MTENPHVGRRTAESDVPFTRVLTPTYPRRRYHRRKGTLKTAVHWGQRKLLMTEIEFLLLANQPHAVVVYAGAAPGTHIQILSRMFPEQRFVLVDPCEFSIGSSDRIEIVREKFSDDLAIRIKQRHAATLFISDVRTCDWALDDEALMQQYIQQDMAAQARWHWILRPVKSLLKFRLPYAAGATEYLNGELLLPVWGPVTTTECRLIVDRDAGTRTYDHTEHEEQMFFFNTAARASIYHHSVTGVPGLDHCYDCTAEVRILGQYIEQQQGTAPSDRAIAELSIQITRALSSRRDLTTPNRIQTAGRRIAD